MGDLRLQHCHILGNLHVAKYGQNKQISTLIIAGIKFSQNIACESLWRASMRGRKRTGTKCSKNTEEAWSIMGDSEISVLIPNVTLHHQRQSGDKHGKSHSVDKRGYGSGDGRVICAVLPLVTAE